MERTRTPFRIMLSGCVLSLVLVSGIFLSMPNDAHAQAAGAGCAALLAARTAGTAAGAAEGAGASLATAGSGIPTHDAAAVATQIAVSHGQSVQDTTKCMLDSLAWAVAKMTIQSITRSTVNWINSGFQGSPAFVTDLQANLNVLSDTVANNFFAQLNQATVSATGFNLVSPFQDQLTQQLRSEYYRATGSLLGLNQYDLQGHSTDPRAFLNGDFSQGGLNAFFSASQNPANNPFGAYMLASNALWSQIDAAAQGRRDEFIANSGFLSWRGNCSATPTHTSGSSGTAQHGTGAATLSKTEPCFGNTIKTPGSVIEAQLETSLGTGIRQLELANSINEVVGALMGQLVNQVLGPGGLLGTSQPSSGGGSSYISQATNVTATGQDSGAVSGFTQSIANDLVTLTTYRDSWQKILDAANAAQTSCGVRDDITKVITQATAGVASANAAIQGETAIQTSLQKAVTSTSVDASSQLSATVIQYQSFLGASTTPTYADELFATTQSTDATTTTNADGTTSTTPTLYTQMVNEKNSCIRI